MEYQLKTRRWLNRAELAEYLGVSVRTVTNWMDARRIPFTRLGRLVRFDKEAIDRELSRVGTKAFNPEKR